MDRLLRGCHPAVSFSYFALVIACAMFFMHPLCLALSLLGAALTIAAAQLIVPALPYLLGFAAGAMLYVVAVELLPTAARGGALSAAVGFTVMMVLDVALG